MTQTRNIEMIDWSRTSFSFKNSTAADLEKELAQETNHNDNIKAVSDILRLIPATECPMHISQNDSIEGYIHRQTRINATQKQIEYENKLRDAYLELGNELFERRDTPKAFEAWQQAFKFRFNIETRRSIIERITTKQTHGSNRINLNRINSMYLFEYCGSFGQGRLTHPSNLMIDQRNNRIIVTDYKSHRISLFDRQGNYLEDLKLKLKSPYGMFSDREGAIWICEFGVSRLVRLASNNQPDHVFELKSLLNQSTRQTHPTFGVTRNDELFLILTDGKGLTSRLIKTRLPSFKPIEDIHLGSAMSPMSPAVHLNRFYLGDFYKSTLFTIPDGKNRLIPISNKLLRNNLSSMVFSGNNLFIAAGGAIMKTSLRDNLIFTADMMEQTGCLSHPVRLAVLAEQNRHYLLVCDFRQACIHKFLIKTKKQNGYDNTR